MYVCKYIYVAYVSSTTSVSCFNPQRPNNPSSEEKKMVILGVEAFLSPSPTPFIIAEGAQSQDSLLVERRTRDRKVASSNPGRSGRRIFFSGVNYLC